MLAALIIALREGLEAALIVGIVLAYLLKTGRQHHFKYVFLAVIVASLLSFTFAMIFQLIAGGFTGANAEIFEGIFTLIAAGLLTTMIVWMDRQAPKLRGDIEQKIDITMGSPVFGVFLVVFTAVFREGVETVLFLFAIPVEDQTSWLGVIIGFGVAIGFALLYFLGSKRINLRTFFKITTIMLILFAAGMLAYGIHELQEAGVLPIVIEHVWDINFLIDETSPLGQILKGLLGYNANPSLLEIIFYFSYLIAITVYFIFRHNFLANR